MRRIVIIGAYGAGKTTLAEELGAALGLPVHHLDAVRWLPGWVLVPDAEWRSRLETLTAGEAWIIDGNFERTLEIRLRRADTVILLDFSAVLSLWRVARRRLSRKARHDLAPGLSERANFRLFSLLRAYRKEVRPHLLELVERYRQGRQVFVLRRPEEVRGFMTSLRRAAALSRDGQG